MYLQHPDLLFFEESGGASGSYCKFIKMKNNHQVQALQRIEKHGGGRGEGFRKHKTKQRKLERLQVRLNP